jgi:hypothetical protein
MKLIKYFILIFVMILTIFFIPIYDQISSGDNEIFNNIIKNELNLNVNSKKYLVEDYILNKKQETLILSESNKVKNMFNYGTFSDKFVIENLTKKYLSEFVVKYNLSGVDFISKEGDLIYSVYQDINFSIESNHNLYQNYLKYVSSEDKKINYYQPYYQKNGKEEKEFVSNIFSPVYGELGEYIGVVVLIFKMEEINDILKFKDNIYDTKESYLVSSKGKLISPFKNIDSTLLVQEVQGLNLVECLSGGTKSKSIDKLNIDNYYGVEVLRETRLIESVNWCLVVDISKESILKIPEKINNDEHLNETIILFTMLTLFIIGFGIFLNIHYYINNRSKSFNLSKSYKLENLVKCLSLKEKISFAILVPAIYYFLILNLVHKFHSEILFNSIPDLIIISICFIIFFKGYYFENLKSRYYLLSGSLSIIISRFIEIFLQEYFTIGILLSQWYWIFSLILLITGVILILLGFNEVDK